jgi:hypothetical protein
MPARTRPVRSQHRGSARQQAAPRFIARPGQPVGEELRGQLQPRASISDADCDQPPDMPNRGCCILEYISHISAYSFVILLDRPCLTDLLEQRLFISSESQVADFGTP